MGPILVVALIIWAAATGALTSVLKIALGVALGISLAGVLLGLSAFLVVRRAILKRVNQ